MKKSLILLMVATTFIFGIKASGVPKAYLAAASKPDSLLINAALLQIEKLPQSVPAIRYLEAKNLIKKNVHYYSILIRSETKTVDDWLVCRDPDLPELLKHSSLPLNVQLRCEVYNLPNIQGNNNSPFIIVRKIIAK